MLQLYQGEVVIGVLILDDTLVEITLTGDIRVVEDDADALLTGDGVVHGVQTIDGIDDALLLVTLRLLLLKVSAIQVYFISVVGVGNLYGECTHDDIVVVHFVLQTFTYLRHGLEEGRAYAVGLNLGADDVRVGCDETIVVDKEPRAIGHIRFDVVSIGGQVDRCAVLINSREVEVQRIFEGDLEVV